MTIQQFAHVAVLNGCQTNNRRRWRHHPGAVPADAEPSNSGGPGIEYILKEQAGRSLPRHFPRPARVIRELQMAIVVIT